MNESFGADGNSWTIPTTWKGATRKRPLAVVEHAQPQQIAEAERVVADRLLRDEDAVAGRAQPGEHLRGAAAEEVGVPQRRAAVERRRVDAEGVLQVGTDVRVGVVDGRDAGRAGQRRAIRRTRPSRATAPGGAVATTSAPSVSCASTRACWS